jgi:hypothetical protein
MTQAERFLTLSLAEVLGRIAGAVMSEGVLTAEKKLEVAGAMSAAGQALGTKTLADLLGVSALSLAPYSPPAAPSASPSEVGASSGAGVTDDDRGATRARSK